MLLPIRTVTKTTKMQKIMFYCQHISNVEHLTHSIEIVRELVRDFQVCFVNGGQHISDFQIPQGVEVINLPTLRVDAEFQQSQPSERNFTLEAIQYLRSRKLMRAINNFVPDIVLIDLFPFGRGQFKFEILPLLDRLKQVKPQTKIVCSLRDISEIQKKEADKYEEQVCQLINNYFDLLLIHSDPRFQILEETFTNVKDIQCPIFYTGYVVRSEPDMELEKDDHRPSILVSIGGDKLGNALLETILKVAPLLENKIPHYFQIFTGSLVPEAKFSQLQATASKLGNVQLSRFTSNLLGHMKKADLSLSIASYSTTMNILKTSSRSILIASTEKQNLEEKNRLQKLSNLGIVELITSKDLQTSLLANKIVNLLQEQQTKSYFDFSGVQNTSQCLQRLTNIRKMPKRLAVSNQTFPLQSIVV
jgi:predicted glycosyltransferase